MKTRIYLDDVRTPVDMENWVEKEFVPYEPSLALKELGFDKPCFGYYTGDKMHLVIRPSMHRANELESYVVTAPTYSQAFRWFREKYGYLPNIHNFNGNFKATLSGNCNWLGSWTKTYEESELDCLIKLIEIVKENK